MGQESIAHLYDDDAQRRPLEKAAIDAEADEGLLLAEYAIRMRLKNRIIVDTMAGSGAAGAEAWLDEVRLALGRLRIEAEASARRMVGERDAASRSRGLARHEHDYRHRDAENLERRRRVYTALAGRLVRWENDDERVTALLSSARDDAFREMRSAITAMLSRARSAPEEDREVLEERLRLVAAVDLPALAADRRREAAGDVEASPEAPEPQDPGAGEDVALPPAAPAASWRRRLRGRFRRR